jgi:hypothetical protein
MPDESRLTPSVVTPGTATLPSGAARPSFAQGNGRRPSLIERAARVAFTFLVMNYSAVAGLVAALRGKKVWR